jgi:hypothetical protein
MSKASGSSANQGIVGSVSANVLAVGNNATAIQNQNLSSADFAQFRSSIEELRKTLQHLQLPEQARASIAEQVAGLEAEATKATPDRGRVEGALKSLTSTTKLISEFVSNASAILGPVAKIASLFGLVLS